MLTLDTIGKIRRDFHVKGKKIKAIARERRVARNTVRNVLRSDETAPSYDRKSQPRPQLGGFVGAVEEMLEANERKKRRERLTFMRMFEELRLAGYTGGYDAVRRYARVWQRQRSEQASQAYVPLVFDPGEAYQFDWSHEVVVIDGVTTMAKVAHMRLCHSRMPFIRAYPREAQEMVFDAHEKAFVFFRGTCERGIYDNMKTAVDAVFIGKKRRESKPGQEGQEARKFNRRFEQMMSHYLVEPTACTPAAGWEKGQVENQVGTIREHFFTPRLKFKTYDELNAYLLDRCVSYAKAHPHPDQKDRTVFELFEEERSVLIPYRGPFDGFNEKTASVSKTCLVRFDRNRYSVMAKAVGRPVDIYAYADRVVIKQDGMIVGEHKRHFGGDQAIYNPWHYVPVLDRKPGALRNGAPFRNWPLPASIAKVRRKLAKVKDGNRQMVDILTAVLTDGLPAVETACAEALTAGINSADVILNILARQKAPSPLPPALTPEQLQLSHIPRADCGRYDNLRSAADDAEYVTA